MKLQTLAKYKQFAIVGFGVEGKSSARFLQEKFPNTPQKIIEKISEPLIPLANTAYIVSPGIARDVFLANIPSQDCTSNTEIFFENISETNRRKIIGITGTKGKSTTTKFLYECLQTDHKQTDLGGNYGVPLLEHFENINQLDFLVAELSSYQLEFLKTSPFYSIFLNIFADHLDRHHNLEAYTKIKTHIFNSKTPATYCVMPHSSQQIIQEKNLWTLFGNTQTKFWYTPPISSNIFPKKSVFNAAHFCENFGTVQKILELILPNNAREIMEKTAKKFVGLPHRSQLFTTENHIEFYDDSISTNPDTSVAAIKLFGQDLGAIILGGYSGGGTYTEVFKTIKKHASEAFIWAPQSNTQQEILDTAKALNFPNTQIITGKDFDELLKKGLPLIKPKRCVVLSPGAKSFDSFANYKKRGLAWQDSVKKYYS